MKSLMCVDIRSTVTVSLFLSLFNDSYTVRYIILNASVGVPVELTRTGASPAYVSTIHDAAVPHAPRFIQVRRGPDPHCVHALLECKLNIYS